MFECFINIAYKIFIISPFVYLIFFTQFSDHPNSDLHTQ